MSVDTKKPLALGLYAVNQFSQLTLLLFSGWFIAACALSGQAGVLAGFNYVIPATVIRFLALIRIASGYFEKYFAHVSLLNGLQRLRQALLSKTFNRQITLTQDETAQTLQQTTEQQAAAFNTVITPIFTSVALVLAISLSMIILAPQALPLWGLYLLGGAAIFFLAHGYHVTKFISEQKNQSQSLNQQKKWLRVNTLWHFAEHHFSAKAQYDSLIHTAFDRHRVERTEAFSDLSLTLLGLGLATSVYFFLTTNNPISWLIIAFLLFSARDWSGTVLHAIFARNRLQTLPASQQTEPVQPAKPALVQPTEFCSLAFLGFHWKRKHQQGLKLSFELPKTGLYWLCAPSGTGKSSLFEALVGELPAGGMAYVNGREISHYRDEERHQIFHYAAQQPTIISDTLSENLMIANQQVDLVDLSSALEWANLDQWANAGDLATWLGDQGRPISGGEQKRLQLARAKLSNAPVWLLDEPFDGLDEAMVKELEAKLLKQAEETLIVFTSHLRPSVPVSATLEFTPETEARPVKQPTQTNPLLHRQS